MNNELMAIASKLNEYSIKGLRKTDELLKELKLKKAYYFSMEFLMGRMLRNNLYSTNSYQETKASLKEKGLSLDDVLKEESDAGIGNGGLGRLAACFLDSSAALRLPVFGTTIRYKNGYFKQEIVNGYQIEKPDNWLESFPWQIKSDEEYFVLLGENKVKAFPYILPIIGYQNDFVSALYMWDSEGELGSKITLSLYPDDSQEEGKKLRIMQEYFLCSASIQKIFKDHLNTFGTLDNVCDYVVIQINDTHPAWVIPEAMRILMDEHQYPFAQAWDIVSSMVAYTNHTVMKEALEEWPVKYVKEIIPRIYQIIEEIDDFYLKGVEKSLLKRKKLAIIYNRKIRMANLAIIASFSINGVAKMHTEIIERELFKDFYEINPEKFNNKTNGITPRRWLEQINPLLMDIIHDYVPDGLKEIRNLMAFKDDNNLKARIIEMKQKNKEQLAKYIEENEGIKINPKSIYDVQIKRLHEYKRQLLNALNIMHQYFKIKEDASYRLNFHPVTYIFGAKSAPSYLMAKLIIKLINEIANLVNNDFLVSEYIKVVFVSNYNVSYAERIIPAADISEQISLSGTEASGTGNMKLMLNGAITLGTQDGANVEIEEAVGKDIYIFGLKAKQVTRLKKHYDPMTIYETNKDVKRIIDSLTNETFKGTKMMFLPIRESLLINDNYLVLADFEAYTKAHEKINEDYQKPFWVDKMINNIAASERFFSDRTILEYNRDIWHLRPVEKSSI